MARLIFIAKPFAGRTWELTSERTSLGRGADNVLVIPDLSLSREHCLIFVFGAEVIVLDLGSRNGTYINGQPLNGGQSQVKHGQSLRFGCVEARLELEYTMPQTSDSTAFHEASKYKGETQVRGSDVRSPFCASEIGSDSDKTVELRHAEKPPQTATLLTPTVGRVAAGAARRMKIAFWIAALIALVSVSVLFW